jgi:hypothetical protein
MHWEEDQDMRLIGSEVAGNSLALVHHSAGDPKTLAN